MRRIDFVVVVLFLCFLGCRERPVKPPETATSGHTTMLVTEALEPLLLAESREFTRIYPGAIVSVVGTSTREAIVMMLNDSVKTLCIDRRLNEEEWNVAKSAGMPLAENKIAEDALGVIVHRNNRMKEVSFKSLREILNVDATSWSSLPESRLSGSIELVLTGKNSGSYELLQRQFFHLAKDIVPSVLTRSHQESIAYVAEHPAAIGFVSVATLSSVLGRVKIVAVESAVVDEGDKFVKPSQMNIYRSLYPLHYSLYLYNAETRAGVGAGFGTFVMTVSGQKVIQDAGLVPVSIPNRIIQINAE